MDLVKGVSLVNSYFKKGAVQQLTLKSQMLNIPSLLNTPTTIPASNCFTM